MPNLLFLIFMIIDLDWLPRTLQKMCFGSKCCEEKNDFQISFLLLHNSIDQPHMIMPLEKRFHTIQVNTLSNSFLSKSQIISVTSIVQKRMTFRCLFNSYTDRSIRKHEKNDMNLEEFLFKEPNSAEKFIWAVEVHYQNVLLSVWSVSNSSKPKEY